MYYAEEMASQFIDTKLESSFCHLVSFGVRVIISSTHKTPWPESASKLYRPRDRRLLAKLVPTFAHRSCGQRDGFATPVFSIF
jgi:hypothetical protein